MGSLRFGLRLLAATLFCFGMWLYAQVLHFRHRRSPKTRYQSLCRGMSRWGYGLAWIFGMKIRMDGTPPQAPFFLVTNHISYTDILLLCATSPAWFISKAEVAKWPGIGALTRCGNTLFLDRETRRDVHRMNQVIAKLVLDGGGVEFYPEGTTSDGTGILPFKPSLLQPAIEHQLPVHVAAIAYETAPGEAPPEQLVAWTGDESFGPHARRLLAAKGFTAHVKFSGQTYTAPNRKELARLTRDAIVTLHANLRAELFPKLGNG